MTLFSAFLQLSSAAERWPHPLAFLRPTSLAFSPSGKNGRKRIWTSCCWVVNFYFYSALIEKCRFGESHWMKGFSTSAPMNKKWTNYIFPYFFIWSLLSSFASGSSPTRHPFFLIWDGFSHERMNCTSLRDLVSDAKLTKKRQTRPGFELTLASKWSLFPI